MKRIHLWTAEEEQELLELAAQGLSTARISARLRRTKSAVQGRLYALLRARAASEHAVIEAEKTVRF